jgi:hypothetical protein
MANGIRGERLQIMRLTVLDDFRFRGRMPSRAAAIRELLKWSCGRGIRNGSFWSQVRGVRVIGSDPLGRKK